MFDIEENIRKIVAEGNKQEMEKLSEILEEVIYIVKDYDEEMFRKYAMCIYKMANGYTLTKEMGEEIVSRMRPYGKKWTIEETTAVKNQFGLNRINDVDFFVVMNSKYNDNKATVDKFVDDSQKVEMYADLSRDFILDPDAKEGKVFKYFM